jgi:hypothetical protein
VDLGRNSLGPRVPCTVQLHAAFSSFELPRQLSVNYLGFDESRKYKFNSYTVACKLVSTAMKYEMKDGQINITSLLRSTIKQVC